MTNLPPDGYEMLRHSLGLLFGADRRRRARLRRAGRLSDAHLSALMVLTQQPEATAGALAKEAHLNPASVTPMVDQLVRNGLLERRRDEEDRRQCLVSLTDLGRKEVEEQEGFYRRRVMETFSDVTPRELAAALKVIDRVIAVMDSVDEIA